MRKKERIDGRQYGRDRSQLRRSLDSRTGVVMSPPNLPGWDNIPIVKLLGDRFCIRTGIHNDANACALAEWKFGAGIGARNMAFLTFGTGLGAGLILDGKSLCRNERQRRRAWGISVCRISARSATVSAVRSKDSPAAAGSRNSRGSK